MKLSPVDIDQFSVILQSCSGQVCLTTAEGDRLVANSCLCRKVGLALFLAVAQKLDVFIDCEDQQDQRRVENFLLQFSC